MKIAAKVQYFGPNYYGFQRQKNHLSVQGKLEETLSSMCGETVLIHGAGRTDRDVSASGQVVSFDLNKKKIDLEDFRYHWNLVLPDDIAITKMVVVPNDFDARHSCIGKRYVYRFCVGEKQPLFIGRVAYLGNRAFDEKACKSALSLFVGRHCFHNFTNKKEDIDGFIRDIEYIHFEQKDGIYEVELKSNGFMTYQIRFMIGAAFKAAFHKLTLDEIKTRLDMEERSILPYKAPGEGLELAEVCYENDIFA